MDLYSVVKDIRFSGGHSGGETPLPIPNRVVKSSCADGTAGVAQWESRTLPDFSSKPIPAGMGFFLTKNFSLIGHSDADKIALSIALSEATLFNMDVVMGDRQRDGVGLVE